MGKVSPCLRERDNRDILGAPGADEKSLMNLSLGNDRTLFITAIGTKAHALIAYRS